MIKQILFASLLCVSVSAFAGQTQDILFKNISNVEIPIHTGVGMPKTSCDDTVIQPNSDLSCKIYFVGSAAKISGGIYFGETGAGDECSYTITGNYNPQNKNYDGLRFIN